MQINVNTKSFNERAIILGAALALGIRWHGEEKTTAESIEKRYPHSLYPVVQILLEDRYMCGTLDTVNSVPLSVGITMLADHGAVKTWKVGCHHVSVGKDGNAVVKDDSGRVAATVALTTLEEIVAAIKAAK